MVIEVEAVVVDLAYQSLNVTHLFSELENQEIIYIALKIYTRVGGYTTDDLGLAHNTWFSSSNCVQDLNLQYNF